MVSLTPERLLGLLDEDTSYCIPPLLAKAPAGLLKHPTLLPGEKILLQQDATCVDTFNSIVEGLLHLTTFRVIFSGASVQDIDDRLSGDDDPKQVARKGFIHQLHRKKRRGHSTIDRFRQKAQNFQESLQAKSSASLKPSIRSKSKDLSAVNVDDNQITEQSGSRLNEDSCKLISIKPISPKKIKCKRDSILHNIIISIPCTNIYEVRKLPKNSLKKNKDLLLLADGIELLCSTLQTYKFCVPPSSNYDADKLTSIFTKYTKHLLQPRFSGMVKVKQYPPETKKTPSKWFAMAYREAILMPRSCDVIHSRQSQNFYNFESEFMRLGLLNADCWKVFTPEQSLCLKSPIKSLVPFGISEKEMKDVIAFHGGKSFPAICWRNLQDDTVMIRSGAAIHRRGLFEKRCEADENVLASVCYQNKRSSGNKLVVFTEQNRNSSPGLLATSQQISGQITPKQGEAFCYPHCKFVYTDKEVIPDHKTVKQSSYRVQAVLSNNSDDKNFLSALAETQWLSQISELLETASLIITAMSADKSSVLISYEEGCDRTAQLSSLSQLLLDPHYRTIDGFQVLIQKEWLSFGHPFAERCISQMSSDGHGPIFLQWLDCVWQLINQFPLSFEFNEEFLMLIADHVYSCRFGTFLSNSERQHEEEQIESKTLSLWTWINVTIMANPERFSNSKFRETKTERILIPRYHIPSLKVWESYYAKTRIEENLQEAMNIAEDQANLVEEMYAGNLNKYLGLVKKISNFQNGRKFESSIEHDISSMISSEAKEAVINNVLDVHNSVAPEVKSASLKASKSVRHTNSIRTLESRSLDNLLESRRPETQSKTKRRMGSSKFYVKKPTRKQDFETALAELNEDKPQEKNHIRKSQTFDGLCDYLRSEGFEWSKESDIEITPATCCGFLTKRGNVRKNWLCRWFKLDLRKKYLAYFEERENDCPKGVIECGKIVNVYPDSSPTRNHKHKFYAETDDRTFAFKAPNTNTMNIWIASLKVPSGLINVR